MSTPQSPTARLRQNERNRAWCAEHRGCTTAKPWLSGPPPYERYLPGASMGLSVRPAPRWPIELRNMAGLHGALTALLGVEHIKGHPLFATYHLGRDFGVHWWHAAGPRFAGRSWSGALFDVPTTFTFTSLFRLKTPVVAKRGRQRVRVHSITPICQVSAGRKAYRTHPSAEAIVDTLSGDFLSRIALPSFSLGYLRERNLVQVRMLDTSTSPTYVPLNGKYGTVPCWDGTVDLEVNAPARWLLDVASRVGFGSRTAFGFGRIKIEGLP